MSNNQHPHRSTEFRERFHHFRLSSERFSNATVFAREEIPLSNVWRFSVAFCSNKDRFDRTVGRSIARRKYFQKNRPVPVNDNSCFQLNSGDDVYDAAVNWLRNRYPEIHEIL